MPIVDRPVDDEPEEKPDQLGRALIRIRREFPGQWREVFETNNRSHAVRIEGCLIGRGEGRIAGASDIEHWEARMVSRTEKDQTVYAIRVRYHEKPHGKDWRTKPRVDKADEAEAPAKNGKAASGKGVEGALTNAPRDPDDAAQAGLDLAAG